ASLPSITGTIKLPHALAPGRYYLFFKGGDYDQQKTIGAALGGGVSTIVPLNDRDVNGSWTDRAAIDVSASSDTLQVTIFRNPAIDYEQKYIFMGLYITSNDKVSVTRYDEVVDLNVPTVMDDSAPVKGNLATDGGFEMGLDSAWGFSSYRDAQPECDTTQAFEGKASLRIGIDHGDNLSGDNMGFISRIY